ncbi:hypothetical protein [Salinilacihabitans rarus]|uniref:hypothetical protein n=1 Tax=Salinilacihabitans rarus TaxID=2961596 RepID=UPI0020C83379|nr:hypothetical protein [Salinilacihabitans rarus]
MPSSLHSRRRLLAAASGCLGVVLAGCTGDDRPSSSSTGRETAVGPGVERSSTHEYAVRFVRSDADEPFLFEDEETAREVAETPEDEPLPVGVTSILFVTDEAAAEELHVEADEDGRETIRTFVEGTDFENETVAIDQRSIGDCYRREVEAVEARDEEFKIHYCRWLKEPTTRCEADRDVMEAVLCRVDRPYEERPRSRGSSESAMCRYVSEPLAPPNGTETSESNGTADGGDQE